MISLNDIAVKNAYRKAVGLLTPMKSKPLEANMVLASSVSTLLGWGAKTITRYEGHQAQDLPTILFYKIDSDPQWFLILLKQTKISFLKQPIKILLALNSLRKLRFVPSMVKARRAWFKSNKGYSGMKRKCADFV